MGEKKKPAYDFKLGPIYTAVWENEKPNGEVWFNVTIVRSFQVNGGQWRETTSFRRDELPIAAKALDMAYAWIWAQPTENKPRQTSGLTPKDSRRDV